MRSELCQYYLLYFTLFNIIYLLYVLVAVGRRFNAASKKENNTKGMSIHFPIKSFPKNDPLSIDPYNIDENNQALKLLLVTAAVEIVLYLNH